MDKHARFDAASVQRGAAAPTNHEPQQLTKQPIRPPDIKFYDLTNKTYAEIQQILHGGVR